MAVRGIPRPEKYVGLRVELAVEDAEALAVLGAPVRATLASLSRITISMMLAGEVVTRDTVVQRYKDLYAQHRAEEAATKPALKPKRPRGRPKKERRA